MAKSLALIVFAMFVQNTLAQPWNGYDDFTQGIDTNRWTSYNGLLQNPTDGLTMSSGAPNGVVDVGLNFNFSLPANQAWEITLRSSFAAGYTPASGGLLETFVGVSSDATWSAPSSSYYANSHQRNSSGYAIVPNWILNQGPNGTTFESPSTITSRETLLRLSYNGANQLTASYALPGTPQNFILANTQDTSLWTDLNNDFYLAIGFYSVDTSSSTGDVTIQSVDIVPEPSSISLLAVGLGVVFRRSRRTV